MKKLLEKLFGKRNEISIDRPVDKVKLIRWVQWMNNNGSDELIKLLENQRDVIITYLANDVSFKTELDIFKKGEILAINQVIGKIRELKNYKEKNNGNPLDGK